MDVNREKVELLGRLYHQFYDDVITHNITEREWNEFNSNRTRIFESLGFQRMSFYIDDEGSRWEDPIDTKQQDEDWHNFQKKMTNDLEDLVIKWLIRKKERGWSEFMEFLTTRGHEFIRDVKTYYQFHRSEDDDEHDDEDDLYYEEIMETIESLEQDEEDTDDNELEGLIEDKPIDTGTDGDPDPSIEDILRDLRGEVEDERRELINGEQVDGEQQ